MRNAIRTNERVTLGRVPDQDDLIQLAQLGYRTLVDVRADEEKFGGLVEKRACELGLRYLSVPVIRSQIELDDVLKFYRIVYDQQNAPVYAFSRFGKKPMAFLVLLEAVARAEPLPQVFRRASRWGMDLRGDLCLQEFLVDFYNAGQTGQLWQVIRELRPDLVGCARTARTPKSEQSGSGFVLRADRERRLGQRGCTVWLTSVRSCCTAAAAQALYSLLTAQGGVAYCLSDGWGSQGSSGQLPFSGPVDAPSGRRIGREAALLADAGLVVVASDCSLPQSERDWIRSLHESVGLPFVEALLHAPSAVCHHHSAPGPIGHMLSRATADGLTDSSAYEPSLLPDVQVSAQDESVERTASRIVDYLQHRGYLHGPGDGHPSTAASALAPAGARKPAGRCLPQGAQ
jgi:adenylylsulfate kinase